MVSLLTMSMVTESDHAGGMVLKNPPFQFLDTPRLVDDELELVQPDRRYVDEYLASCRHPRTVNEEPHWAKETASKVKEILEVNPLGRFSGKVNGYSFWMRVKHPEIPLKIAGNVTLRVQSDEMDIARYIGHIGYHVFPIARGFRYAERSVRLLFDLARQHQMRELWITCNPDNPASRRTCERLGGELIEIIPVPKEHELYARGDRWKCRYLVKL